MEKQTLQVNTYNKWNSFLFYTATVVSILTSETNVFLNLSHKVKVVYKYFK